MQAKACEPSTKVMRATAFLRSAIAASSAGLPVLHGGSIVQAPAAFALRGWSKCTTPPSRHTPGAGLLARPLGPAPKTGIAEGRAKTLPYYERRAAASKVR